MIKGKFSEKTLKRIRDWDSSKDIVWNCKNAGFNELSNAYSFSRLHNLSHFKIKKEYKWNTNFDIRENAKANNINVWTMREYKYNNNLNCATRKQARINKVNKIRVIKFLKNEGFTFADIGRLFSVTRQRAEQMFVGY